MNTSELEIEKVLRAGPKPAPPVGLKEQLIAQIRLGKLSGGAASNGVTDLRESWLRRWWLVLTPAAVSLFCAMVLAVQHFEIRDLQDTVKALLPQESTESTPLAASQAAPEQPATATTLQNEPDEITRLKSVVADLRARVSQLEQLKADNEHLRAQLAAPAIAGLTAEEADAMAKAKEKANSVRCINNLKQMGLAVRTWALDHGDMHPPDVISMSNELSTPIILTCPSDTNRQAVKDWKLFSAANMSYEYLAPDGNDREDPMRVLFRCPIHGHIGLCDGSVQSEVEKRSPESLVQRDGKLFLEPRPKPVPAPAPNPNGQ